MRTEQDDSCNDAVLVERSISGDKRSLNTLLGRYQDYIYNISLRMFLDPEDAKDATQEVLIKVLTGLRTFQGKSRFKTWIYRITVNHFLNAPQRKMEKRFVRETEHLTTVSAHTDSPKITEAITEEVRVLCATAMLMCLNREQRLVYIIGEVFGADHALGTELFRTSKGNYRVKLHRAKAELLNYVSGRCGIIDPSNPCRCPKKAKVLVSQGVVDGNNLKFNTSFTKKIGDVVDQKKNTVSDKIQLDLKEMFQSSPFQVKKEIDGMLERLLER
ncbi:RNA polymerase sigma factor [Maribacter sp. 2-571]|uniref:RNA polymerase sigma factor n=1 Tax=Maribacter sp. 2-571 TaxID=3417569 RepID=UPI003D331749